MFGHMHDVIIYDSFQPRAKINREFCGGHTNIKRFAMQSVTSCQGESKCVSSRFLKLSPAYKNVARIMSLLISFGVFLDASLAGCVVIHRSTAWAELRYHLV